MDSKNPTSDLRKKLLEVGKTFKTFAVSEESDKKKNGSKDSSYKFTPGWTIVEKIREKLDNAGIKLEPNCVSENHEMISYPVYKIINGVVTTFEKKEMYVTVTVEYNFYDTTTGEVVGPFRQIAAGANGTDKSISSALSLAERYFLLKYFQITTREPDAEPDMHDSENIPGIAKDEQPVSVPEKSSGGAQKQTTAPISIQQPASNAPVPPQVFQQPATPLPQNSLSKQQPQAGTVTSEETYSKAIESLAYFNEGTDSHTKTLNYWLTQLRLAGYDTSDPAFVQTLSGTAQAKRLGQI